MRDNKTYLNEDTRFLDNHPVYCGYLSPFEYNSTSVPLGQLFTHMEGQPNASNKKYWLTPGFRAKYVMGPFAAEGVINREITNAEIRTLLQIGYNLDNAFANSIPPISSGTNGSNTQNGVILSANHKPECITDFSCMESAAGILFDPYPNLKEWADGTNSSPIPNVTVDFPNKQNDGTPLDINLNTMPSKLVDADGDIITVIPSSITGIRGVSNGDNNHGCLTLINNNQTIRYLPRANFIGRAQFYCQLFDGKELGSLALFTIDVTSGSGFSNTPINEMIINGSFEEGTEVKDLNSITNTNKEGNFFMSNLYEGQFYEGFAFADSHPLWQLNTVLPQNPTNVWTNLGLLIHNCYNSCSNTNVPYSFGGYTFPYFVSAGGSGSIPDSYLGFATNKRYAQFSDLGTAPPILRHTNYSTLSSAPIDGEIYKLECDIFFVESYASTPSPYYPSDFKIKINFTDQFDLINPINCFEKTIDLGGHTTLPTPIILPCGTAGQWEHVTKYFQYCCTQINPAIKYMELMELFPNTSHLCEYYETYIDNISLTPSSLSAANLSITAVSATTTNCFNHQLDVKVLPPDIFCNISFSWLPTTFLTNPNIQNPLALNVNTPITYTVTVTDGYGLSLTSTVTILPQITPTANAYPSTVCQGGSVALFSGGGGSTATYSWLPTTFLTNPNSQSPLAQNVTSTITYTVTVSEVGGCTATTSITVTLAPPPVVTATATSYTVCPNGSVTLTASGANTYVWNIGTAPPITGNPIAATTPGIYTVTGTDVNGCVGTTTLTLIDGTFIASITGANCGLVTELYAWPFPSNMYTWIGPFGSPPPPTNSHTWGILNTQGTYTVIVTDASGCTATATFTFSNGPSFNTSSTVTGLWCFNQTATLSATLNASPFPQYTYLWTPIPPAPVLTSLNNLPIVTTGTLTANSSYSVVVTDAVGCTNSSIIAVNLQNTNNNYCCSPDASAIANDPNTIQLDDVTASSLGPNPIISNTTFFVDGVFTIDDSKTFHNCHFYFTPNSRIEVQNGMTLTIDQNSILESPPNCDMWDGIYATSPSSHVIISGNVGSAPFHTTIKNALHGIVIGSQSALNANDVNFEDNNISIQLQGIFSPGAISLLRNKFITLNPLLPPLYPQPRGENGIILIDCAGITIGDPLNVNNRNHFENLYNGIYIRSGLTSAGMNTITTTYNTFKNIKAGPSYFINPALPPWVTPFNVQSRGCAIFGMNSQSTHDIWLKHYGNNGTNGIIDFDDCQKCVLLNAFGMECHNSILQTSECGFMDYNTKNKVCYIRYNKIQNTFMGVMLSGDTYFCDVHGNDIITLSSPSYSLFPPLSYNQTNGVFLAGMSTYTGGGGKNVDRNKIFVKNELQGTGIYLSSIGSNVIHDNEIHFTSNSTMSDPYVTPTLIGMNFQKTEFGRIENNSVIFDAYTNTSVYNSRQTIGIGLRESPNQIINCNTNDYLKRKM